MQKWWKGLFSFARTSSVACLSHDTMASACSLCSAPASHACHCLPSPLLLCSSHVSTHTRSPGKHLCKSLSSRKQEPVEVLEWMRAKLKQERSLLGDGINEHFCAATTALFQLYSELQTELERVYAGLDADLQRLREELESGLEGQLAHTYRLAVPSIKSDTFRFLDVKQEASRCILSSRLPLFTVPSLLSLLQPHTLSLGCSKSLPYISSPRSMSVKSAGSQCKHWGSPCTYKVYACCKRNYPCAQCHDQAESHARGTLVQEICVVCGEKTSQGRCDFCSI